MSQTVVVKIGVDQTVEASDRIVDRLELRDILPEQRMQELLVEALESRGFEREGESTLKRENEDGSVQTVDLESLEVVTEVVGESELKGEVEARVDDDGGRRAQEDAARERVIHDEKARIRKDLSKTLADGEEERTRELNEVMEEIYAGALKEKAQQLGKVVSQQESRDDNGEYQLTIKVEV